MDILSVYIKEQKRYTIKELSTLFRFNDDEFEEFIKRLKSYGVLKAVKKDLLQKDLTELNEDDVEITDDSLANDEVFYVFTFVGVITFGNIVLKCYPKYITSEQPYEEIKEVLKVLNKYSSLEQIIKMFNKDNEKGSFNLLAVILYLIQDYYENGIYSNTEDVVEINGEGSILWTQTISDGFAIINENQPFYVELYTQRSADDEQDYFTRLHKAVLSECSRQLEESGLLGLFDYDSIELSEENVDVFGETEYILYRIQNELNIQFNTRRQLLLQSVYAYISQQKMLTDKNCISLFGTTKFNLVWEKVCADVFENKLHVNLNKLRLPFPLKDEYKKNIELIDIIDKPQWFGKRVDASFFMLESQETLRPDLIGIYNVDNQSVFVIFDAKYYCIQIEENKVLRGQPSVGDVTKQYLYQLAYDKFIKSHGISVVKNCFLMPTEKDKVIDLGYSKMPMFEYLKLEDISIRLMPARYMYHCYLENKRLTFKDALL